MNRTLLAAVALLFAATARTAGRPCEEASARLGYRACVHEIADRETWQALTVGSKARFTRYMVPSRSDARLPVLFSDSKRYEYHTDLLRDAFRDVLPGIDDRMWVRIMAVPREREFYAGNVLEQLGGVPRPWRFTVEEVAGAPIGPDDVRRVWVQLQPAFPLGKLAFLPSTSNQRIQAAKWPAMPFPIEGEVAKSAYEAYVPGRAVGVVRKVKAAEVDAAALSYEDVVVLDEAPFDLPQPVAGVVTAARHAELSHLNVRSAARGTPSCFAEDAWARLGAFDGQLVAMECGAKGLVVGPATADDAAKALAARRPKPVAIAPFDPTWREIVGLRDLPTTTSAERATALTRYGAKGRNLAVIAQRVSAERVPDGLLVPFAAYEAYARGSDAVAAASDPDPTKRRARLAAVRDVLRKGRVDPAWIDTIARAIEGRFGTTTMVRLRSSSNAEDALAFSGAGLYDSTSVCLADDRDADDVGPSLCDPATDGERGLARGLRRVWASLWNERAVEERAWYGIDHATVSMAVLVTPRFAKEQANLVAFTGSPGGGAAGFVIDAQAGEAEVVAAEPGVWPERTFVRMNGDSVVAVERLGLSSLAPVVLSEARVREVAAALAEVRRVFPVDEVPPTGATVLLDTEWKIDGDGKLVLKQVRPFLRRGP